jgi:hypothetical protein
MSRSVGTNDKTGGVIVASGNNRERKNMRRYKAALCRSYVKSSILKRGKETFAFHCARDVQVFLAVS